MEAIKSRWKSKRYRAVVWRYSTRQEIINRHICLQCSAERSGVGRVANSGSRDSSPAQRNIEAWMLGELKQSCLPLIRHSAHQCCAGFIGIGSNDCAQWICNTTIWLAFCIAFTLSFFLLNLVVTTSAPNFPKDIYNCPDVTLRCIISHLYHAVFITTSFFNPFYIRFYHCTAYNVYFHWLHVGYVCYMWH